MNQPTQQRGWAGLRTVLGWLALAAVAPDLAAQSPGGGSSVLYGTGFEVSEGYTPADQFSDLRGQLGWLGEGSGGNGLLTNFFDGWGQQAYIGFTPPAAKDDLLNLWRPITPPSIDPASPVLRFSVLMQVVDSTNGLYDDFRWSVYNTNSERLFTLDFDNSRAEIFYALDEQPPVFHSTGFKFSNGDIYDLSILMNLARNDWIALMNGRVIVDAQPMTTTQASLSISDVDAVWVIRGRTPSGDSQPGNNYMLWDDYLITSESESSIPPILETVGRHPDGTFELVVHGERGLKYSVDVTSDMEGWTSLGTNVLTTGALSFPDPSASGYDFSFYRARQVSP